LHFAFAFTVDDGKEDRNQYGKTCTRDLEGLDLEPGDGTGHVQLAEACGGGKGHIVPCYLNCPHNETKLKHNSFKTV